MSRYDDYGAYHRESSARLLHQVYAYSGDTEVAKRALSEAFASARRHWRTLRSNPDKDAWMRERAFTATTRTRNRSRQPWYAAAMTTADEHHRLLTCLRSLAPSDRRLVILVYLGGLDLTAAAHEVGAPDDAAETRLTSTTLAMSRAGLDPSPDGIASGLDRLRTDLHDESSGGSTSPQRGHDRRRSLSLMVAGLAVVGITVGAWALISGVTSTPQPTATPPSTVATQVPTTTVVPEDPFTTALLTTGSQLRGLEPGAGWAAVTTSPDFGADAPFDECVTTVPSESPGAHHWTREFVAGRGRAPRQATQALQVAPTRNLAVRTYSQLVDSFASCPSGLDRVVDYRRVTGVGDTASLFTLRFVKAHAIRTQRVAMARSGNTVVAWAVQDSPGQPVRTRAVVAMLAQSVRSVCGESGGSCVTPPYAPIHVAPPSADTPGFLAPVDMPLFTQVNDPWVATDAERVEGNPAATVCDQADFSAARARHIRSRTFVVPDARRLAAIFGMTETLGTFPTATAAQTFSADVTQSVSSCSTRETGASVTRSDPLHQGEVNGRVWEIRLAASANKTFIFRMALLRVGTSVAQITFTPSGTLDLTHAGYVKVATRGAQRLSQL